MCQTRVQASTLSFPEIISKLPQVGVKGLYRGSIPAILGQFSRFSLSLSHIHRIQTQQKREKYKEQIFVLLDILLSFVVNVFCWHCSHGLRTGIFEASKLVLINVAPTLPDIQVNFLHHIRNYYPIMDQFL